MSDLVFLILSKDRPLQLDGLLRSFREMVGSAAPCVVLYRASSARYQSAYAAVFARHNDLALHAVAEQDFKTDVLGLIRQCPSKRVAFLVDDQIFVAPVELDRILQVDPDVVTYSLRLGRRITRCQPLGDLVTGTPTFVEFGAFARDLLAWQWEDGVGDWQGPNSLDGNVLSRAKLLAAFDHPFAVKIKGPQTLEASLNKSLIAAKFGVCNIRPQLINLAVNRVSNEDEAIYPHGADDAERLLIAWEAGQQMALTPLQALEPDSCHIICDLPLEPREAA